jgi:hypothetical protein
MRCGNRGPDLKPVSSAAHAGTFESSREADAEAAGTATGRCPV